MIRRVFAAVLAVAGTAGLASAQTATLMVVESVDPARKELVVDVTLIEYVQVAKEVAVEVNGRVEKRVVTEVVPRTKSVMQTMRIGDGMAYNGAGKKLDTVTALKGLKKGSVVVMGSPELADKKFAGVFSPDTVLLLGAPPPAAPPGVVPAPVAKGL